MGQDAIILAQAACTKAGEEANAEEKSTTAEEESGAEEEDAAEDEGLVILNSVNRL